MQDAQEPSKPESISVPTNITVTLKQDKPSASSADWERTARILSLVAIPVVIAVFGGIIQATLSHSTVNRDYVQLAVSVLTADKSKTPQELRDWAVDLLNENAPTKFSPAVAARLKGGEIGFPGSVAAILSTTNGDAGMAASPDGKLLATSRESDVRLWDLATGKLLREFRGHTDRVNGVAFSPDGLLLASGSSDKTVRLWDVATGAEKLRSNASTEPVFGVAFSHDGRNLFIRSSEGTILNLDIASGRLTVKFQVSR